MKSNFFNTDTSSENKEQMARATDGASIGAGINISGQDWLGLGQMFGSLSQGTELCGSKPVCFSIKKGSNCDKKQTKYNDCLASSMNLMASQVTAQNNSNNRIADVDRQKKIIIISVVSLISLAIIIGAIFIIRKQKK